MKEMLTSISSTKNNMSLRITVCDSFHWYGYLTALGLKTQTLYMLIQRYSQAEGLVFESNPRQT